MTNYDHFYDLSRNPFVEKLPTIFHVGDIVATAVTNNNKKLEFSVYLGYNEDKAGHELIPLYSVFVLIEGGDINQTNPISWAQIGVNSLHIHSTQNPDFSKFPKDMQTRIKQMEMHVIPGYNKTIFHEWNWAHGVGIVPVQREFLDPRILKVVDDFCTYFKIK